MTPSSPDPTPDPRRQGIADMSDTATPRPDLIVKQFADGTRWEKAARDRTPDPRLSDAKRTLYEVMAQLRDAGYHDWPDLLQRDVLPALAQARSPADEGLRAALRTADERARELTEYHVPNVHTSKTGRATVDSIETEDGRTIVVCAGCGQEYPCDSRELADMVLLAALAAQPAPAPGLDVERLAEALHRARVCENWSPGYGFLNSNREHEDHHGAAEHTEAPRIAAEYARLSKGSPDDPK
jgi:hypothetical protein